MSSNGIKCGHCSTWGHPVYHADVPAVRECGVRTAHLVSRINRNITLTRSKPVTETVSINPWKTTVPRSMVENMREGRYAVEATLPGQPTKWIFLRVWRPTKGKRAGQIIVQTQHSEHYKPFLVIFGAVNGSVLFVQQGAQLDMALMVAAADPVTSAINYGRELGRCSRCGRELTDERSRYYSIGPECEGHWSDIIDVINAEKGTFESSLVY